MFNFKSSAHSFNRSRKFIELAVGREKLVVRGKDFPFCISFLVTERFENTLEYIMSLKGGYTRYEVEHISCNLLLHIGKT